MDNVHTLFFRKSHAPALIDRMTKSSLSAFEELTGKRLQKTSHGAKASSPMDIQRDSSPLSGLIQDHLRPRPMSEGGDRGAYPRVRIHQERGR